jgi:hypothetical protein
MSADDFPDLTGKHVTFYVTGKAGRSYQLQDIQFETQGGRLFVGGRVSENYDETVWARGFPVFIAWDVIEQYIVFDSPESYHNEWARHERAKEAKASSATT